MDRSLWGLLSGSPGITGEYRPDKKVLIFYHIWHPSFMKGTVLTDSDAPRDISRIIAENKDALSNEKLWGHEVSYHYWGEPLFGYYDISKDEYVLRKHAQMLTDAGVDAIVIDYSNYMGNKGASYTKGALSFLLNVFNKVRDEGGDTPSVTILCTWGSSESAKAAEDFYTDFYMDERYEKLWFQWKGKPLILANPDLLSDRVRRFFTVRKPHPFYTPPTEENAWPWLSVYPQQPGYTKDNPCEIVSAGVAQNWSESLDFMSAADEEGNFIARGRSYTSKSQKLLKDPVSAQYESEKGANFQECFDRAIALDPDIIFITGWNEWIAARFLKIPSWARCAKNRTPPFGAFCDAFTTEFSRDIEPTREGNLGDSFYIRMVSNIRRFKGVKEIAYISDYTDIKIDGRFEDWKNVKPEYRDDKYDISLRDSQGIGNNRYINNTGRNDFTVLKAAYDKEYIYFYAETADTISPYTDNSWMNLYIRISDELPGWEGYNFVINRKVIDEKKTCLDKSKGGNSWQTISADIPYRVSGNKMELAVKREFIGLTDKAIAFWFKWADNTQHEGDILAFYTNGDCAPNGRFSYIFKARDEG